MSSIPGGIDGIGVRFDDGSLVADAGLLLAGTVMSRLGLEAVIDAVVRPPRSGRGSGAKALSVAASMLVGGSFIDDADRLRSGSAQVVLPFVVVAPSTLGTWLRSFTWGHVRQLDKAQELALGRAWHAGAAPAVGEMTVDLDSTVCEVYGRAKGGAAYGHAKVLGYHPVVAVRDDTGEMIHARMRSGSSQRGHVRFVAEPLARLRRLAPDAKVAVRADSGFFSYEMIDTSGKFFANAAHLACAALAHNIARWTARLGHVQHPDHLTVAATVRRRLLEVPGRVVNHSQRHILRMPAAWPSAHTFTRALTHIRNLPLLI